MKLATFSAVAGFLSLATALTIAEINGDKFLSPYSGQLVADVRGLVLAKGPRGIYLRSTTPDDDAATSEAIYVYSSSAGASISVGDVVSLCGQVSEYRSADTYLYLTEIVSPTNVTVLSTGNDVVPLVIGKDTFAPPTRQFSSRDGGDVYGLPNAVANISSTNPTLDPEQFGLDFWESLSGELVTVTLPTVLGRENSHDEFWVVGDWATTGKNAHDGLTMTDGDANPEAIIVGQPLDKTRNPAGVKMGDQLDSFSGVVTYQYGFYSILPTTAVTITSAASADAPASSLVSTGSCSGITVGDYNVENLTPTSAHLPRVAAHIVHHLNTPDMLFVQEIQDSSGATDDSTVDANATLSALAAAIEAASKVTYAFVDIDPVANQDGGQPGGNIRVAYLYRPDIVSLHMPNPGSSTDANDVLAGPTLKFNPGRIDPANAAWDASRKPLAAMWRAHDAATPFFTVNVHLASKSGGDSLHGDRRPPSNGAAQARLAQANVTASFVANIVAQNPEAMIIAAGDFNEFAFVEPLQAFVRTSGLRDLEDVVGLAAEERYTYSYDMNAQALDHMYVSPALEDGARFEHVHVNSWASAGDTVSDHDPSVARLNVCG